MNMSDKESKPGIGERIMDAFYDAEQKHKEKLTREGQEACDRIAKEFQYPNGKPKKSN